MHHTINLLDHYEDIRKLARSVVRGLPPQFELDDLISVGVLAFYQCAESFDAARGVPFWAFAYRRIRGAMVDSVRSDYRHTLRRADLTEDIPAGRTTDPDRGIAAVESQRSLSNQQRCVISIRMHGHTKRETGRRLGLSEQWVGKLESRAIASMRVALAA